MRARRSVRAAVVAVFTVLAVAVPAAPSAAQTWGWCVSTWECEPKGAYRATAVRDAIHVPTGAKFRVALDTQLKGRRPIWNLSITHDASAPVPARVENIHIQCWEMNPLYPDSDCGHHDLGNDLNRSFDRWESGQFVGNWLTDKGHYYTIITARLTAEGYFPEASDLISSAHWRCDAKVPVGAEFDVGSEDCRFHDDLETGDFIVVHSAPGEDSTSTPPEPQPEPKKPEPKKPEPKKPEPKKPEPKKPEPKKPEPKPGPKKPEPKKPESKPEYPENVCGSGFSVIDKAKLGDRGVVYLLWDGRRNCVATIKTKDVGTPTPASAFLQPEGEARKEDPGQWTHYAGPVTAEAPSCVKWGGSIGNQRYASPLEHCSS